MTTPINVRTLRSLCAHRLEAEITTALERFMVLGETDRIGVDVDTSAMKGPHPNIRAGCGSNYMAKGRIGSMKEFITERI
jgi:hypothetical protein